MRHTTASLIGQWQVICNTFTMPEERGTPCRSNAYGRPRETKHRKTAPKRSLLRATRRGGALPCRHGILVVSASRSCAVTTTTSASYRHPEVAASLYPLEALHQIVNVAIDTPPCHWQQLGIARLARCLRSRRSWRARDGLYDSNETGQAIMRFRQTCM